MTEDFIKYKVVLVGDNVSSLYKIAYSEDKKIAVAVGWNGDNYYSYNLEDWESMSNINKLYIRNPVGVKYILETKKFFAYGLGFEGYGVIYYSEDGLGWTVGTTTAYYGHFQYVLNDIAYSKKLNRYVLIGSGNRFTSEDGHTWELRNNNEGGSSVIYVENEDKFYIARGVVQISSDGINFSNLNITNINKMFYQKETQKIIIIDTTGNIYISFNVFNKKFLASYTLTSMNVKLYNSDIFVFGVITSLASRLDLITQEENENIISKISASSNLNLCLEQGNNILFLSEAEGNATLLLKYRQKYIGV